MKRLILFAFTLSGIALSSSAFAETCTAPGHPSCTVTCAHGCGALYSEPNGPCRTMCSANAATAQQSKESVGGNFQGASAADIQKLLNSKK